MPTDGLAAFFPFNGNAGDESGTGNNGTVHGATLTTDRFGNANHAYFFNGTSDYIEVPSSNSLKLTTGFTINAWVCLDSFVIAPYTCNTIVSKVADKDWSGGYELKAAGSEDPDYRQFQSSAKISGINSTVIGLSNYSTGTWYMVTTTYDGIHYRLYVNGSLADEITCTGTVQTSDIPLRIGRRSGAGKYNNWFQGKIDDIRIYNRGLTQADIDLLFIEGEHTVIVSQPESKSVCADHSTSFSVCAGGSDISYIWQVNSGTGFIDIEESTVYSGARTSTLNINNASDSMDGYSYRCIVSQMCMLPSVSDSAILSVNSLPQPAGSIQGKSIVFQEQPGVAYNISPIPGATGYIWNLPQGATIVSGDNTNNILVDFSSNASSGDITVTGTNNCGPGNVSPVFQVTVKPVIPAQVSVINQIVGNGQTACQDAKQTITVAGEGTFYLVLNGGSASFIAGQNTQFLSGTNVLSGGYMHGSITNTWDYCGANGKALVQNPERLEETPEILTKEDALSKIYPNPTTGKITLEIRDGSTSSDAGVIIYNMMGKQVYNNSYSGSPRSEISLEKMPSGIYMFLIIKDGRKEMNKIIKL